MNRIKRFMGRKGILLTIALTALLVAGYGNKKEPVKTSEAEASTPAETATEPEAGNQELPNPMMEVEDVLTFETTDVHIVLPEEAEDISFFTINQEVTDTQFTLDDVAYTYRTSGTTRNFAGIFEQFKNEAIAQDCDYGETSLEVLIKTTDGDGHLALWERRSTKYTLYTTTRINDEAITDLTVNLAELSQYERQFERG